MGLLAVSCCVTEFLGYIARSLDYTAASSAAAAAAISLLIFMMTIYDLMCCIFSQMHFSFSVQVLLLRHCDNLKGFFIPKRDRMAINWRTGIATPTTDYVSDISDLYSRLQFYRFTLQGGLEGRGRTSLDQRAEFQLY